jgi:hypothetical protein
MPQAAAGVGKVAPRWTMSILGGSRIASGNMICATSSTTGTADFPERREAQHLHFITRVLLTRASACEAWPTAHDADAEMRTPR